MGKKCQACGTELKSNEPFILEGEYPSTSSKILKPAALRHVQLSWYGNLYHKECYKKKK